MKNQKRRGINAEREIINFFWNRNGAAVRVAGSGAIRKPSPDIIASLNDIYAIEVKKTENQTIYLKKDQIQGLSEFANIMRMEPILVIKFKKEWKCINARNLEIDPSKKLIKVSKENCLNIEQYFS